MKKTLHRHEHPIHWHGSMLLAVAALLLTSVKCSGEMLRALQAVPTPPATLQSIFLRDTDTEYPPLLLSVGYRHTTASGR